MATFLFIVVSIVVVVGWLILRDQIQGIESRIRWSFKEDRRTLERQIAELTRRISTLEQQAVAGSVGQAPSAPAFGDVVREQKSSAPDAPLQSFPGPVSSVSQKPKPTPIETEPKTAVFATPPLAPTPSLPTLSDRLRKWMGDSEWEALVAGSLLNKIGALILVIGIALFLGYSFRHVNPAGRAASASVISTAILIGGVVLERRQQYRLFSRGLIGAGWAALYTTAYAMYALPAARVISNPFAGSILLLAVSAGMIAHSLRYRTQAVTAVAYFSAFAALAATTSSPFAVASLIPLSASLLYFARRFEWHAMALFGLFATYATCISRGDANAPLYATTSLLFTYWLLFELFDILRSRRNVQSNGLTWIFPLNAIAFLGLTYRVWSLHSPQAMWQVAAISASLFFASAMVRLWLCPATSEAVSKDPFECIRKGTYEAPLVIASILAGLAILGRVRGFWTNVALAFEAEIIYLAGVRFRSGFLRWLGRSGFFASFGDVIATAWSDWRSVTILGVSLHNWTPSVIMHMCLFYLNRGIAAAPSGFSFAATGLAALVIACEVPTHIAPLALFALALILLELALRKPRIDFRIQSYLVASAAAFLASSTGGFAPHAPASVPLFSIAYALACWLFTARILFVSASELAANEIARVRDLSALGGSAFALLTLWMLLPGPTTAAAWTCFALVWLAIASLLNLSSFRWIGAGVLGLSYVRLLGVNLSAAWDTQNAIERWLIPLFIIGALYCAWHVFGRVPDRWQRSFAPVFTWLAAIAAVWLLAIGINRFYAAGASAMLGLALLAAGLRMNMSVFRWQSYFIAAWAMASCLLINFTQSGSADMFARVCGGSLVIACLFAIEFFLPRNPERLSARERYVRVFASLAAMLLLTVLLYHEVSGGLLTVAWGLEALACMGAGFPARERILRLQGLGVFALCILKLFVYDLRNLETAYRILSFIALGAILLGVSLIYTRFRGQIQRYL